MKTKLFLFLMTALLSFTQCKKDGENGDDSLTSDIVGRYDNLNDDNLVIVVNKVDDNTVSISVKNDAGSSSIEYTFATTKMNSKTSFTLNEININDNGININVNGSGTVSGLNISLNIIEVYDFGSGYTETDNDTYIATKIN